MQAVVSLDPDESDYHHTTFDFFLSPREEETNIVTFGFSGIENLYEHFLTLAITVF